ncbi:MAG: DUF2147 domain-containing protein [Bacteroidota bacterium]
MKNAGILFLCFFSFLSLQAQMAPIGTWNTGTDNSKVAIQAAEGNYVGTLISSDNTEAKLGIQLLKDFKQDGKGWKAKFYAPKRGEWLDAKLETKGNLLLITVGSGFLSKTLEWEKE